MAVAYYIDVHVPDSIVAGLCRRGVDVLTVIEDGRRRSPDEEILERAKQLGRVVFTMDVGFRVRAESWQRQGRPFAGLIFAHQLSVTIGQCIGDLELIAKGSEQAEWRDTVQYLPL